MKSSLFALALLSVSPVAFASEQLTQTCGPLAAAEALKQLGDEYYEPDFEADQQRSFDVQSCSRTTHTLVHCSLSMIVDIDGNGTLEDIYRVMLNKDCSKVLLIKFVGNEQRN